MVEVNSIPTFDDQPESYQTLGRIAMRSALDAAAIRVLDRVAVPTPQAHVIQFDLEPEKADSHP